jgi:predicted Zn-dependent protease
MNTPPLSPDERQALSKRLNAVQGYLHLGMYTDAWKELEAIEPKDRGRIEVLKARLDVCSSLEKWELMAEIAQHLGKLEPEEAEHPINLAFAVRRLKDTEAAAKILEEAKGRFPEEGTIPYNLACYRAVSGKVAEAKTLLAEAFSLDASLRITSLDDPDLAGVWDSF